MIARFCVLVVGIGGAFSGVFSDPEPVNLLRNGSFEEQAPAAGFNAAKYWKMNQPDQHGDAWGSASRERWPARDGEYVGAIRGGWAGQGFNGGVWQETAVEPGATYRFSGWFVCDEEWIARTQEIKIEFWDETSQVLVGEMVQLISDCETAWKEISVETTAPPGAARIRVVVNIANFGAMGSLLFDDLCLVKQVTP